MKSGGPTNIAASVRRRLLNLSEIRGADFNAMLAQFVIERFLYRLSRSTLADRFVLKGAMLFRVWAADLHRPTRDLDLLGFGDPSPDAVAASMRTILATSVPDDGLRFDPSTLTAAETREAHHYGGIRATVVAMLGAARLPMQIDIGFGDSIIPPPRIASFPTLLDQGEPQLQMYPPETVVAEKFEAIVKFGMANSRMKDYYDLMVILRRYELDSGLLAAAIAATFKRRGTAVPERAPVGLSDEFARDSSAQRHWAAFLRRSRIKDAPASLPEVVRSVWSRIEPAVSRSTP